MKIRRKPPKASRSGRPLYIVGYSGPVPALSHLQAWFDLEYGGPLRLTSEAQPTQGNTIHLSHGPWGALVQVSLSPDEAEAWKERLEWIHPFAARVVPLKTTPADVCDQILHAARLARGLTLLSEGTAFDLSTHTHSHPSDWQDRPLEHFNVRDHLMVMQADAEEPGREWFYTRGLLKFARDEIETYRPVGLPSAPVFERLAEIADKLIRLKQQPRVGETFMVESPGLSVKIHRHRTLPLGEAPIPLREVQWEDLPT